MISVKEEIWADKDGNPVPFGDERGVTVLHGAGAQITEEEAKRLGIKAKAEAKPEAETAKAVDGPPATKAVKGPESNK